MRLIPAISIKGGHVATVRNGRYAYLKNSEGQYRSPTKLVRGLKSPGEEVFILDIDGLERNSPDLDTVKRIAAFKDVWLDAGIGDADSMMDAFVSDASRVVMGTICMQSLDELGQALAISDNVIFSIGFDHGVVSPDPEVNGTSPEMLMAALGDIPNLKIGLFFDLGGIRDGTASDLSVISGLPARFEEFYFSGHVKRGDIAALENLGVTGIIMDFRNLEDILDEGA
jgi:uncharacterized protein related to proFAR isomerase